MNRQDKTRRDQTRVEFSLEFDPNGKIDAEFSGKLSPRTRQILSQWRRWLPALVTILTTVAINAPTPVPPSMQPHPMPTVEMPTGVNQNR